VEIEINKSVSEGGQNDKVNTGEEQNTVLDILNTLQTNLYKIREHGHRADRIVKSMLQHSSRGVGQKQLTNVNILVKEFVNLAFHGMRAGKNPINVDIELQLDDNIGEVKLIAEDFSRVLVNMCNNAFDAMRDKAQKISTTNSDYLPKIIVRTIKKKGQVIVEIEDNGPGIPEEIKDQIMEPFFTTKKGTEGTGLGLYITNEIVKAHGGSIEIKDVTGSGRGTRFSITIPITPSLS
jgi:signal transduction histidine kinase